MKKLNELNRKDNLSYPSGIQYFSKFSSAESRPSVLKMIQETELLTSTTNQAAFKQNHDWNWKCKLIGKQY